MNRSQRIDMLKTLLPAREACRSEQELTSLGFQLDVAIDFLTLLVAGERKCSKSEVVSMGERLCSPKKPFLEKLDAIEEAVRDVYADFEDAVAKERYEDGPRLTLGDRMVLDAVDDAVWMLSGMRDDARGEGNESE